MLWTNDNINYLIKNVKIKTINCMASELNISERTVGHKLEDLRNSGDIGYYSKREKLVNRLEEEYKLPVNDILKKMHWDEEKPIKNMAEEFNVSRKALSDLMDSKGIKRRTISEDNHRRYRTMSGKDKMKQVEKANLIRRTTDAKPRPDMVGKNHYNWKGGKHVYTCCNCGKDFERHEGNIKNPDFITCSFKCKYAEMSKRFRGENNACWRGGKHSWRGGDWREVVKLIRERDRYTCQCCGMTQDESLEVYKTQIQIHHKVPYRLTKDNSLENLISLCNKCHTYIEQNLTVKSLDDIKPKIKI